MPHLPRKGGAVKGSRAAQAPGWDSVDIVGHSGNVPPIEEAHEKDARRAVERVARESYGRLVAYLSARTRDVAAAEDAMADALVAALATWPQSGVPREPRAWLLTAARRLLIDRARHEQVRKSVAATIELVAEAAREATESADPDERLKLMFVCAHPAIDPDIHTPLMLQAVLGMDAAKIARAFLVSPSAMSQRLVRAKAKIRDAGIAFEVPEARELAARLDAVLSAIYAAYGSGWEDATGVDAKTRGLADEAIWLARLLVLRMPEEAEAHGLLALMLYCEARRNARRAGDGRFVPLSEQDPDRWDTTMIDDAEQHLAIAAGIGRSARFQLEAAIQSAHVERARSGRVNWEAILWFHDRLVEIAPAIGARVSRAAATAEARGPAAGLCVLDEIDAEAASGYQPYWALRAHLSRQAGHADEARRALDRAIDLADDEAVRRFLADQRT